MHKPHFLKSILSFKKQILILFLLGLFSSGFVLLVPYISKLFIDKAFIEKDFAKFLKLSMLGAVIFIFSTLLGVLNDVITERMEITFKVNLARKFIKKFYLLDLDFFQSRSTGENVHRFLDTEAIVDFILKHCPVLLEDLFKLLIILVVSLWINAHLTLALLFLSPLFLLRSLYIQKKLGPIYRSIWQYRALVSKEIYEAFSKVLIIKALGLGSFQRRVYLKSLIKNMRWRLKSFRWSTISSVSATFVSKAVYGAITLYGGWLIIKGKLTLGSYTAVMLYIAQLGAILGSLGYKLEYFTQGTILLEKFFEVMNLEPRIKDLPGAVNIRFLKGEIHFNDVWFGYQQNRPILKGVNFTIPPSFWISIVGPSGCGKTTLVNLILRLYEPSRGKVLLDGLDLRLIRLESLRKKIAIATQQPFLFDVPIKENIAYGLKGVSEEQITQAAKAACVHDFIVQLPKGYDTLIGEDACRLSQGLKQRIAIARAIARDPDLLILDEATSSVDSPTEERIFKALREKRQGLSTIVVSHRLFSIKDADRIYFFRQDGNIEEGTHSQLLFASPLYRDFFQNQQEISEKVF
jgi:ATP-binding cassette subfamily B protein